MTDALLFGFVGSAALVVGGALGAHWRAPMWLSGILLAFASGTLISALAFELFPQAVDLGGLAPSSLGLLVGGATFVVVNTWLDARVARSGHDPYRMPALPDAAEERIAEAQPEQTERLEAASADNRGAIGLALLAAVTLDGVPENLALGVSLLSGDGSFVLLVAIFASNLPESLVGAVAMRRGGRSVRFVIGVWVGAALLLTAAVLLGYGAFANIADRQLAFPLAFAGGAVLASLADTLMPEAFEHGRPFNSLATAAGFLLSFVLSGA